MNLIEHLHAVINKEEGSVLVDKKSGKPVTLEEVAGKDLSKYEVITVDNSAKQEEISKVLFDGGKISYAKLLDVFLYIRSIVPTSKYNTEKSRGVKIDAKGAGK